MKESHRGVLRTWRLVGCIGYSLVLCALMSGCGGSAGSRPPSPSSALITAAACALVSSAEVSTAFQEQVQAGTKASGDGEIENECLFISEHGLAQGSVAVEVVSGVMASTFYANGQQKLTSAAPVSGVGDKALLEADGSAILAIKGQIAVFIAALLTDETVAERGDGCVRLVKLVLSKTG